MSKMVLVVMPLINELHIRAMIEIMRSNPDMTIIAGSPESIRDIPIDQTIKDEVLVISESAKYVKPIKLQPMINDMIITQPIRGVIPPSHRGFDPALRHHKKRRR